MKGEKSVTGMQWLWLTIAMPICVLGIVLGIKNSKFGETLGSFVLLLFTTVFVWSPQSFWVSMGQKLGAFVTTVIDKFS